MYTNNQKSIINENRSGELTEEQMYKIMNQVAKEATNSAIASQFPEWDLKPPATFIRRKRKKS